MKTTIIHLPTVCVAHPTISDQVRDWACQLAAQGRYARVSPNIITAGCRPGALAYQARPALCNFGAKLWLPEVLEILAKQGFRACEVGPELIAVANQSHDLLTRTGQRSLLSVAAGGDLPSISGYLQVGTLFCHTAERSLGCMNAAARFSSDRWFIGIAS